MVIDAIIAFIANPWHQYQSSRIPCYFQDHHDPAIAWIAFFKKAPQVATRHCRLQRTFFNIWGIIHEIASIINCLRTSKLSACRAKTWSLINPKRKKSGSGEVKLGLRGGHNKCEIMRVSKNSPCDSGCSSMRDGLILLEPAVSLIGVETGNKPCDNGLAVCINCFSEEKESYNMLSGDGTPHTYFLQV